MGRKARETEGARPSEMAGWYPTYKLASSWLPTGLAATVIPGIQSVSRATAHNVTLPLNRWPVSWTAKSIGGFDHETQ
jgi:hypothetical protein